MVPWATNQLNKCLKLSKLLEIGTLTPLGLILFFDLSKWVRPLKRAGIDNKCLFTVLLIDQLKLTAIRHPFDPAPYTWSKSLACSFIVGKKKKTC